MEEEYSVNADDLDTYRLNLEVRDIQMVKTKKGNNFFKNNLFGIRYMVMKYKYRYKVENQV